MRDNARTDGRSISVFFPAYNDAESLPSLISNTFDVLSRVSSDFEVIVVNDGSRDDTAKVISILQRQFGPRLRAITHAVNRGYGAALASGFRAATKFLVFYTDGDGQYDVTELPLLLAAMEPDTVMVNGYKLKRLDPWYRIWIGVVYNFMIRAAFRISIRDVDCDFRLIRSEVMKQFELTSSHGVVCVELVKQIERTGGHIVEVGVHHHPRRYGRSEFFRFMPIFRTAVELAKVYVRLMLRRV